MRRFAATLAGLTLLAAPGRSPESETRPDPSEDLADRAGAIADASGIAFECRVFELREPPGFFVCRDDFLGLKLEVIVTRWDPRHPPVLSPGSIDARGRRVRTPSAFPALSEDTSYLVATLLQSEDVRALGYAGMSADLERTDVFIRGEERDSDGVWVSPSGFLDDDGRPGIAMLEYVLGEPDEENSSAGGSP